MNDEMVACRNQLWDEAVWLNKNLLPIEVGECEETCHGGQGEDENDPETRGKRLKKCEPVGFLSRELDEESADAFRDPWRELNDFAPTRGDIK